MKNGNYKRILYFIGLVILITLSIQVYWNYRNYQIGKQQLINEVQISLDNAVDQYYASTAQNETRNTIRIIEEEILPLKITPMKEQHVFIHVLYDKKVISSELVLYGTENCYPFLCGTRKE